MARPRLGVALGGGSARGWAHIGVLEALREGGIEPDVVCGCSIGALVGAAFVAGRLGRLSDFAQSVTRRQIVSMLDVRVTRGGFISGEQVVSLLRGMRISGAIEGYAKPFAAVATDIQTGGEVWLREGPIDQAVRASISLPGIFRPVRLGERWLVDGGLVNPVPVSTCRALGADVVIAVDLNGDLAGRLGRGARKRDRRDGRPPKLLGGLLGRMPPRLRARASAIMPQFLRSKPAAPGYFEVLAGAIYIMQHQITRARLESEPPDVVLAPLLPDIGFVDFNRAPEAIAAGRACVERALYDLRGRIG